MKDLIETNIKDISGNRDLSPKGKIIRVAEQLFAKNGIENTSLREIAEQAGQKNPNAVQYHFESKDRLIHAIWQRHASKINSKRLLYLDELTAKPTLNELVKAMVMPIAECLSDTNGGQYYLLIMSQLVSHGESNLLNMFLSTPENATSLLLNKMQPYLKNMNDKDRTARMLLIAGVLFHGLSDYLRLKNDNAQTVAHVNEQTIIRNIIAMIESFISAPVNP